MRKILHDHKFQALEASWRGLFFMVRRTETDSNLSIHLLDATKDDLAADLRAADDLAGTFLYKTFVTDTIDTPGADRWSAIVGDYAFRPEVDDIAMLARVAKLCAVIDAPFVSHIRPDVLGVASLYGNEDPRLWKTGTDSDFGKLWAALRSMPESEYLGLAVPRFLARLPYGSDTEPLETFFFEEFDTLPVHDTYLWANPAFVCGLLLAQSFSEHEWEMGNALKQDIEDLPLHLYKQDGETVYTPCSEVLLTESAVNKLIEYGLMPLISFKNTDRVRLGIFQSVTDPPDKLKGRWN